VSAASQRGLEATPPRRREIRSQSLESEKEDLMKIEQIMTQSVKVCGPDDTLNCAAQLMWENDCGCLPIVASNGDGSVIGMITDRDICMAAYTQGKPLSHIPVAAAMSRTVIACRASDGVSQAEAQMRDNQVRRLPVLGADGRLAGIVTINDIAREARREASTSGRKEVGQQDVAETLAAICQPRAPREVAVAA
jgi:CBS domain-containing protein